MKTEAEINIKILRLKKQQTELRADKSVSCIDLCIMLEEIEKEIHTLYWVIN